MFSATHSGDSQAVPQPGEIELLAQRLCAQIRRDRAVEARKSQAAVDTSTRYPRCAHTTTTALRFAAHAGGRGLMYSRAVRTVRVPGRSSLECLAPPRSAPCAGVLIESRPSLLGGGGGLAASAASRRLRSIRTLGVATRPVRRRDLRHRPSLVAHASPARTRQSSLGSFPAMPPWSP